MTGKRIINVVLYLVLCMICLQTRTGEANSGLTKIKATLSKFGKNENSQIQQLGTFLQSKQGRTHSNTLTKALDTIGDSLDGFTAGDIISKTQSALGIISSISQFIPKAGPIISVVADVFSQILGIFGAASEESMEDVVKRVINDALGKFDESQIRAKSHGVARMYGQSLSYLKVAPGKKLRTHEIAALASNVPVYQGVTFIGLLESKIKEYARKRDTTSGNRALFYTNLYVHLATLRSCVLLQMYTVVLSAGHSPHVASAIKRVIDRDNLTNRRFVKIFAFPEYDMAFMYIQLVPSKQKLLQRYMKAHQYSLKYFTPSNRQYRFENSKYRGYYMYSVSWGKFKVTKNKNHAAKFTFQSTGNEGYYYIRVNDGWSWVIMKALLGNRLKRYWSRPGSDGVWKILPFKNGDYMMTASHQIGVYPYMTSGHWVDGPWNKNTVLDTMRWRLV